MTVIDRFSGLEYLWISGTWRSLIVCFGKGRPRVNQLLGWDTLEDARN